MANPGELDRILDIVDEVARDGDVPLGALIANLGARGFGPLLILLSGIVMLPTGIIPGVPAVVGFALCIFATQLAFGQRVPWLPARLRRIVLDRGRVCAAVERARKPGALAWPRDTPARHVVGRQPHRAADHGRRRLPVRRPYDPLRFHPDDALRAGPAVLAFGIALSARDGLAMVLGCALYAAPLWLAWHKL